MFCVSYFNEKRVSNTCTHPSIHMQIELKLLFFLAHNPLFKVIIKFARERHEPWGVAGPWGVLAFSQAHGGQLSGEAMSLSLPPGAYLNIKGLSLELL